MSAMLQTLPGMMVMCHPYSQRNFPSVNFFRYLYMLCAFYKIEDLSFFYKYLRYKLTQMTKIMKTPFWDIFTKTNIYNFTKNRRNQLGKF